MKQSKYFDYQSIYLSSYYSRRNVIYNLFGISTYNLPQFFGMLVGHKFNVL